MKFVFNDNPAVSKTRFLFSVRGPEAASVSPDQSQEVQAPAVDIKGLSTEQIAKRLENKYGPKQFKQEMSQMLEKRKLSSNLKKRLLRESRVRYEKTYDKIMKEYFAEMKKLSDSKGKSLDAITSSQIEDLATLSQMVSGDKGRRPDSYHENKARRTVMPSMRAETMPVEISDEVEQREDVIRQASISIDQAIQKEKETIDRFAKDPYESLRAKPSYDKLTLKDSDEYDEFIEKSDEELKNYIKVLDAQYLIGEGDTYEEYAEDFSLRINNYAEARLKYLADNATDKEQLSKDLKGLNEQIRKCYEDNTGGDGIIDLANLTYLRHQEGAKGRCELEHILNRGTDKEVQKQLENMYMTSETFRESWVESTEMITSSIVNQVKEMGNEEKFTEKIKQLTNNSDEDFDIDDAEEAFTEYMAGLAGVGVKETLDAVRGISKELFGENMQKLRDFKDVRPKEMRIMAIQESVLMLSGTSPYSMKTPQDKALISFIKGDVATKRATLNDPLRRKKLFAAIKTIQKHYPKKYNAEYRSYVQNKRKNLSRSTDAGKPYKEEEAARLLALINLSKEADIYIDNILSSSDYENSSASTDRSSAKAQTAPQMGLKFKDHRKLVDLSFVSAATRGGFSGKGLFLTTAKVWAGATIALNLLNAIKKKKFGSMITNPYILAAGGAIWGINKYQENPEIGNYLKEDAAGQMRIATHLKLNSIAKKIGRKNLKSYIHNPKEASMIRDLMKDPRKGSNAVKNILKKANKRPDKYISKKDLEPLKGKGISIESYANLQMKGNERTRYMFFNSFLTNKNVNVSQLTNVCQEW